MMYANYSPMVQKYWVSIYIEREGEKYLTIGVTRARSVLCTILIPAAFHKFEIFFK